MCIEVCGKRTLGIGGNDLFLVRNDSMNYYLHWQLVGTACKCKKVIPKREWSPCSGCSKKLRHEGLDLHRLLARIQHNSCCYVTSFCNI